SPPSPQPTLSTTHHPPSPQPTLSSAALTSAVADAAALTSAAADAATLTSSAALISATVAVAVRRGAVLIWATVAAAVRRGAALISATAAAAVRRGTALILATVAAAVQRGAALFSATVATAGHGRTLRWLEHSFPPPTENDPKKQSRAKWTDMHRAYLVELLQEHNKDKWRGQNGWNKEGWRSIHKAMITKFSHSNYTLEQVKDQEQQLKKQFKAVKNLVEMSGFGWDADKKMVSAPSEVWEPLINVRLLSDISSPFATG
ncbi:uncharacterized protein LOC109720880, partial [Ananas comosus]|uniref:Uncharacterized protein LOC109720880 n=1 Tax=Ananas comosus TaxID=4615 RepID=A0A6P5G5E6_ANACO